MYNGLHVHYTSNL